MLIPTPVPPVTTPATVIFVDPVPSFRELIPFVPPVIVPEFCVTVIFPVLLVPLIIFSTPSEVVFVPVTVPSIIASVLPVPD